MSRRVVTVTWTRLDGNARVREFDASNDLPAALRFYMRRVDAGCIPASYSSPYARADALYRRRIVGKLGPETER